MRPRIPALAAALLMLAPTLAMAGDFALRDGDTVVLLGDSITAARTWGRIVENYTLLRFPERRVHFHNAAWGGDTASGGLARMDRDVLAYRPTVLIVAYGVNDIGWGMKADDAHKQAYLDGIRGIVEKARAQGCRVYIGSAAATAEDPEKAEHGYLQTMCDEGMALARSLGEHSIDIQRGMRAVQRRMAEANARDKPKEPHTLHVADGVHLNDLGQLAMAFAVLEGLDAPAEVSSAAVDANGPALATAEGCKVSNLKGDETRLEFDRLDAGLPLNLGLFGALQYRFIPVGDRLNRYMLTVRNLPEGEYAVTVDGRGLGKWPAKRLAEGVNIASATANGWEPGGPWEAVAWSLAELTQARGKLSQSLLELAHNLPDSPPLVDLNAQAREANRRLEDLQHSLVAPRPFHFIVERAKSTQ